MVLRWMLTVFFGGLTIGWGAEPAPPRLRLATYNLENYLLETVGTRAAKPEAAREKIAEMIAVLDADVLALQEVGGAAALEDVRRRAAARGLSYPQAEIVHGWDTNIQVALLSRIPITARRPHTNDSFLLSGRRFRVSRGFLEADLAGPGGYRLTVLVAHLKSRRTVPEADEAEMRAEEARLLAEKVAARVRTDPAANVVVLGDLNDHKDSEPIRRLLGRGSGRLVDTRPAERNGDTGFSPNRNWEPRTVTWTHYYGKEDTYGRIDYILLHPNAAREWLPQESYIPVVPDWGRASDHRPIVVTLTPVEGKRR